MFSTLAVIRVSFTTFAVRVNEDVPSGSTQVCLIADSASARQYTIEVGRRPSGNNPATRKLQEKTCFINDELVASVNFPHSK